MEIDIRAMGFTLTEGIRDHVESRIRSALRPFAAWVVKVTARLEDVNANHGGIDKRCSVVAAVRRRGTIVTEAIQEDLYVAADKAAARVRRSVQRLLTRQIRRERKDPQRPGTLVTP